MALAEATPASDRLAAAEQRGPVVPRATYRLQLHAGFDFDAAAAAAAYISALGVSHVYSSPYLQAAPGSTHGYDVVNPRQVNVELGGPVAHDRFSRTLGERGLGQVLDVVPNHMAIGGPQNPWWTDVLENGQASRYARFFDVDWDAPESRLRNTVLLPVLGDHYGRVLEAGELRVMREDGSFFVGYADRRFPLAPPSLEEIVVEAGHRAGSDELVFIGEALGRLPDSSSTDRRSITRRNRDKEVLRAAIGRLVRDRPEVAAALDAVVGELNADVDRLDALLGRQNYRLAFWRAAGEDLGYRRFFDVTTLIGVRMEDELVFRETHELIVGWLQRGVLDGVRIDHPDGLRDPRTYFERLRRASPRAWIVAEKILEPGEDLPSDWPVAGTTGYDFMNRVGGLWVDPAGEAPLTQLYAELTGTSDSFAEIAYEKKRQVLRDVLASEVNRLTELLVTVIEGHRRHRDYSRAQLRLALTEVLAAFPVYRTYVRAEQGEVAAADREHVDLAIAAAARRTAEVDADLFRFVRDVLLLELRGERESELVMRFQQLSGAVMAKGVEDTAFYTYFRLASLNEVGGDPGRFGVSTAEFHAANARIQQSWPSTMLSTATHDHKRGEDTRCRMSLISEVPNLWRETVLGWIEHNRPKRSGRWPDRNTEYLVYQTLVGTWPIAPERLWAYVEKAIREAKVHTSWTAPDARYERAVRRFVERLLDDEAFTSSLEGFVAPLLRPARLTSLSQTLLKLTSPGVPDIYQGTELWDESLVDPDNRRPVDYELRRRLLETARSASAEQALAELESGLPKMWLIARALGLRARRPELFGPGGGYAPLAATGAQADRVVAFARGGEAIVVAPRLWLGLERAGGWSDTRLVLPGGRWQDELGGDVHEGGELALGELLARFPVALLMPAVV
jgi:(1->4)-alpha-D-glucan 1-alpha-D-glucosylmutase